MPYAFWTRRSPQSWVWIMFLSNLSMGLSLVQPVLAQTSAAVLSEPEWVIHRRADGGEIKLEWKDPVMVHWKAGVQELSLSSNRPVGTVPIERLMSELNGYLRNLRYGYDNVLFELAPSVEASVSELPNGVKVFLTYKIKDSEPTEQVENFETKFRERQRVRLLHEVARIEAGQPCQAMTELETLRRELPRDESVISELVRAQWLCGAWSDALLTVENALAEDAMANSTRLSALRRGILREHGERFSADLGNRHAGDLEHSETVSIRWRNRIGQHYFMNLDLDSRSIRANYALSAEGEETAFKGNRFMGALMGEFTRKQLEVKGGLHSNVQSMGAEVDVNYAVRKSSAGAMARYNVPYGDYVEGWIHYATRHSLSSYIHGRPAKWLYGKLALGWNSTNLPGGRPVAESVLTSVTLAARLKVSNPLCVLRYTLDVEKFDDIQHETTANNTPFTLLPVQDRTVHGIAFEVQQEWAKQWRLETTLGYAAGKQGEEGPFIFANVSYGNTSPWRLMVRGSHYKDWNTERVTNISEKGVRLTMDGAQ